jgi:hypothetical protein
LRDEPDREEKSKIFCPGVAAVPRGGISRQINASRPHKTFRLARCEEIRDRGRPFGIVPAMNLLRAHSTLCIVIFVEESFLSSAVQRLRDVQTESGKLIGMIRKSRWITGSLRMSYMTGRRVVGSQE